MAQAKFQPIITSTTGLNNTVEPVRLAFDYKTGETELAQAVNVNIDNSGMPSRRLGRTRQIAMSGRCGFSSGETCLFVSDNTLYQMHEDYSLATIRSDLTLGARMRYRKIANRVYYTNGFEKGYVYREVDRVWSKGDYSPPGDTRRTFSDPPNGHLVSWFGGRALIAKGNAIFASEPSFYGVFDLHNNFRLVPEHVTMLQPTSQGLWVGTSAQVLFYRGSQWEKLRREPKAEYGVLEGSDVECPPEKIEADGRSVLFTTPQGICAGGEDGSFANLTHNKLKFPSGRYASASIVGDRYLVLIEG
jgi:hypothetical protein